MSKIKLLGIDPGRTTGWGLILSEPKKQIQILQFGQTRDMSLEDIEPYILEADVIVCEEWKTRPTNARGGSFDWDPMETPQVIGALKVLCRIHEKLIVEQSPAIKPPGYGFLQEKYVKGKKNMHKWDALAHAAFYAVRNCGALPLLP